MRFITILILAIATILPTKLVAQFSVSEKSGKKPDWTMSLEKGFIVGIGNAVTIEDAKENAITNVKAQITTSVADFISSSSTSKTSELTADKFTELYQSFSNVITTQSGKRDYLQGISPTKVTDFYWEKLTDKKTKATKYQYFVKYPFSSFELDELVADFREKDQQLTNEMEKALAILDNFSSIEEIAQSESQLTKLQKIFIDERKAKCETGIERCKALFASAYLANANSELGKVRFSMKIGDKIVRCARKPVITSQCAVIEDRKLGEEICEISYRFDECYTEPGNNIKVVYTLGNNKPEKAFYFDVAENKAELALYGNIRIDGGNVASGMVSGATITIPLLSKFDSETEVTNLSLEWKEFGIILDIPLNEALKSKGAHQLKVSVNKELPVSKISTSLQPNNKLNGAITYKSVKTGKSASIRIYRADYTTGW